ncbi:unnamed protein product [Staurois parvus]|uniref:Uncharacterized protein n=1 Tax=Staurois parvus TaxID=386267 RepID=A0ABN9BQ01_9NEOB|nr:unnamed protein product [Staurois parvus]
MGPYIPPPHAAARPLICHGPPYTASSCCCQVQSLSWVPVRPPIAAVSIATLSHVPLSGLLTLLRVEFFDIRVLADYGPPMGCCQVKSAMGPRTASRCCWCPQCDSGSLYGLPLLPLSPHSAMPL